MPWIADDETGLPGLMIDDRIRVRQLARLLKRRSLPDRPALKAWIMSLAQPYRTIAAALFAGVVFPGEGEAADTDNDV